MHHVRHFTSKDLIHVNICIILPKVLKSVFVDYDIIFTILAQTAVNICLCITQSHSNWKLSEPLQNGRNITVTRNLGTSRTRTKMFWAFFFFFTDCTRLQEAHSFRQRSTTMEGSQDTKGVGGCQWQRPH